jgi:hypothetical protein
MCRLQGRNDVFCVIASQFATEAFFLSRLLPLLGWIETCSAPPCRQADASGARAARDRTHPAMPAASDQSPPPAWAMPLALLLAAAAIGVALLQQAGGVRLTGPQSSHDGAFAVATLRGFLDAQAQGDWLPRWSVIGNGGLGAPIFFFYPPGAYAAASLIATLAPRLPEATVIGLGIILFRLGALLSCAAWLRRRVDAPTALLGGALYALMPYVAIVNPQVRLAFAESAAAAVLPLVFLAIDAGAGRAARTILFTATAIALLAVVHLPMTVLVGGLAVAYGVFSAPAWRAAPARGAAVVAGLALGLGLAGITVLPALLLQPASQLDSHNWAIFQPENHFLFTTTHLHGTLPHDAWNTKDSMNHGMVLLPMLAGASGWWLARRAGARRPTAILPTLALAVFCVTPLSAPAWEYLPALRRVQFPFRFALPISALGAAALALGLARVPGRPGLRLRLAVTGAGLGLAGVLALLSWATGDHGRPDALRTREALASLFANAPEYVPAAARAHPWQVIREDGPAAMTREGQRLSGCAAHRGLAVVRDAARLIIPLEGCTGEVILPQFHFPGWVAEDGVTLAPDPATGLLRATVPPGIARVVLTRAALPAERRGLWLSLAALAVSAGLGLGLARPGRRAIAAPPAVAH